MKTVLITGASSGIGEATAKRLAAGGYRLILVARNSQKLQSMCTILGSEVYPFTYDLNDLEHISTIFDYCLDHQFILNGLVYCAGVGGSGAFRSIRINEVQQMMQINCMAFVEMGKLMTLRKYSANDGSIVAISSLGVLTAYAGTVAYTMSKAALNAACRVLSKELLRRKIRVNTIMPGYVRTPMANGLTEERLLSEQPFGFVEPEEIAYLIEFLLSDKSRCITGATIPMSAGMDFC